MKKIWFLVPVWALFFSCRTQTEQDVPAATVPPQAEVFYATTEGQEEDTKVFLDENLKIRWDADDRISIFRKDVGNNEYRFAGVTGDNAGYFEEAWTGAAATGAAVPYNYAVYP